MSTSKKIIGVISLALVLSFVIIVSAEISYQGDYGGDMINNIHLEEGWNLVAGLTERNILQDSEIQKSDIEVIWYYSPIQKKYLQIYPNSDDSALQRDDDDFVLSSGMWVYSNKAGNLKYNLPDDMPHIENRQLYSGWNFIAIDSYASGKTLNEISGDCNIEKGYAWDIGTMEWDEDLINSNWRFEADTIVEPGRGIIVKVEKNCKLGKLSGSGENPPEIPN